MLALSGKLLIYISVKIHVVLMLFLFLIESLPKIILTLILFQMIFLKHNYFVCGMEVDGQLVGFVDRTQIIRLDQAF